tara:strand:+ start:193 stop:546 length:354 start_codon:yes stop_codon:yes gene_type:complete
VQPPPQQLGDHLRRAAARVAQHGHDAEGDERGEEAGDHLVRVRVRVRAWVWAWVWARVWVWVKARARVWARARARVWVRVRVSDCLLHRSLHDRVGHIVEAHERLRYEQREEVVLQD